MTQGTTEAAISEAWTVKVGVLSCCLTLLAVSAFAQAPRIVDGANLVEADGYAFNIVVKKGEPTRPIIVLESGGGYDASQWAILQPRIAAVTGATVIAYDRPGFGKSPLPDNAYNIISEADAIRHAIASLGLGDRVVLVGHSYGALLIQIWAARAPGTVVGLLFLDPNSPSMMLAAGSDLTPHANPNAKSPRDLAFNRIDIEGLAPFAAVYTQQIPLDIPIIVVSAETPPVRDQRQIEIFRLSHELLAKSVRNGKRVIATGSNHNLHTGAPDLIVALVQELLAVPQKR